jgi:DNA-directed RNA polymerase specialized sigma24 family protein
VIRRLRNINRGTMDFSSPSGLSVWMSSLATNAVRADSFEELMGPYRAGLHAHCYHMLGSSHDADDALHDALLRAWRALPRFEGRSSVRSWLYRIATNSCLRLIERRPKRVLPIDYGPPSDAHDDPAPPLVESVWVEPYPDAALTGGFQRALWVLGALALLALPAIFTAKSSPRQWPGPRSASANPPWGPRADPHSKPRHAKETPP